MSRFKQWAVAAICVAAFASPCALANLVSDPGFELDDGSWAVSGWGIGAFDRGVHSGHNAIATGCPDPDFTTCTFSQSLVTIPGTTYNITFWLYADGLAGGGANTPNGLQVSFDGVIVDTILDYPSTNPDGSAFDPGGPSALVTISTVLATTGTAVLQFGGYHDASFIFVDDVSVQPSAAPEPATLALFGLGLAGLGFSRRRKL